MMFLVGTSKSSESPYLLTNNDHQTFAGLSGFKLLDSVEKMTCCVSNFVC